MESVSEQCQSDCFQSPNKISTAFDLHQRFIWKIQNMDCPSCAQKLTKAMTSIEGIEAVKVSFASQKLMVDLTNKKLPSDEVLRQIEQKAAQIGFPLISQHQEDSKPQSLSWRQKIKREIYLFSLIFGMALAALLSKMQPELSQLLFYATTLLGLFPIARKAWRLGQSGSPFSIETLMSIAALGALYLGETVEAGMVLLLFLIGERLEGYAAEKARTGVKALMALVPETVTRIHANGQTETIGAAQLSMGDRIQVSPGERLPADAILCNAQASFDFSALTGESIPVEKVKNERIPAGALSVDRLVQLEVVSKQGENAIDRILALIENAEAARAPVERFIDRFSRWYTPLMMVIASLVVLLPPLMFAQSWDIWLYRGLTLLLIACPCALVISTPAAMTSGLAAATRRGVLIKGGATLEALSAVDTVVFDKTGTLTQGKPQVTDLHVWQGTEQKLLLFSAAIEQGSHHPLAKAVLEKSQEFVLDVPQAQDIQAQAGRGVSGVVAGKKVQIIALDKLEPQMKISSSQLETAFGFAAQGKTVAILFVDGCAYGVIAWRDEVREDALETIRALKVLNLDPFMLTGDNEKSAHVVANSLDIRYQASLMPEGKVNAIHGLDQNRKIVMVGDGINDAPAMKAAHVGIAMGSGTDVALETADVALSHNRIESIPEIICLARATMRNIHQNVILAVGLKVILLVTSILGLTGLWLAILADSGATALVTLNALRLLRFGKSNDN